MLGVRHLLTCADGESLGQDSLHRGSHLRGTHSISASQQEDVAGIRVAHQRVRLRVGEERRGSLTRLDVGGDQPYHAVALRHPVDRRRERPPEADAATTRLIDRQHHLLPGVGLPALDNMKTARRRCRPPPGRQSPITRGGLGRVACDPHGDPVVHHR